MIREEVSKLINLIFLALHLAYALYLRDILEVQYIMIDIQPLLFLLLLEKPPKPPEPPPDLKELKELIFWSIFIAAILSFLDLLIYFFWLAMYYWPIIGMLIYYWPIVGISLKVLVAVCLIVASAMQWKMLTKLRVPATWERAIKI